MAEKKRLSLTGNIAWNSVGSTVRLVCNYMMTIVVVRLSFGFDAAGGLALAMAISNLVTPFADFRLRTIHVTDVTNERTSGEYVGIRILTSVGAFVVGVAYACVTSTLTALPAITLYLVYSLITNFIEVYHAIDQRNLRMDYCGKSYLMQGIGTLGAFSVVLWLTNSLEWSILSMVFVVAAIGVFYVAPTAAQFEPIRPKFDLLSAIRLLITLFPLVIAQVSSSAVLTVPRQYAEVLLGSAALGIYASVAAPATIVQMGATYIYSPLMGEMTKRLRNDKHSAMRLFSRIVLGILGVAVVSAILLLLLGEFILEVIFGRDIVEHTYLLLPAVICTFITAFSWFMNDMLLAVRDFKASFLGNVISAVVAVVITRPFVSYFGLNGISWVGVASYGVSIALMSLLFFRHYQKLGTPQDVA